MTAMRGKPLRRLAGVRSELSKVRNEIGMVSGHPASRTSSEVSDVLASVSRACGGISLERVRVSNRMRVASVGSCQCYHLAAFWSTSFHQSAVPITRLLAIVKAAEIAMRRPKISANANVALAHEWKALTISELTGP